MPGIGFSFSSGYRNMVELGVIYTPATRIADGTAVDGNTYVNLGQILIPANTLRPWSHVFIETIWTYNSTATAKSLNVVHGPGTSSLGVAAPTTTVAAAIQSQMWLNGSMQSQRVFNNTSWQSPGSGNAPLTHSVDYTQDVNITWQARWAGAMSAGVDTITLERAVVFAALGPTS